MSEKNAYEQSAAVGYALLNQLTAEQAEQERTAEFQRMHKKAFRVAFDMLEKNWPPENTVEYWKKVTNQTALDYHDNRDNMLCGLLMMAVTEYLEKVSKEGVQGGISGVFENKENCQ